MSNITDDIDEHITTVMNDVWGETCFEPRTDGEPFFGNPKSDIKRIEFSTEFESLNEDWPYVVQSVDLEVGFKDYDDLRNQMSKAIVAILSDKALDALWQTEIYNLKFILGHNCRPDCECIEDSERLEKWKTMRALM